MIRRVWEICTKVLSPESVYVATDDDRITKQQNSKNQKNKKMKKTQILAT